MEFESLTLINWVNSSCDTVPPKLSSSVVGTFAVSQQCRYCYPMTSLICQSIDEKWLCPVYSEDIYVTPTKTGPWRSDISSLSKSQSAVWTEVKQDIERLWGSIVQSSAFSPLSHSCSFHYLISPPSLAFSPTALPVQKVENLSGAHLFVLSFWFESRY